MQRQAANFFFSFRWFFCYWNIGKCSMSACVWVYSCLFDCVRFISFSLLHLVNCISNAKKEEREMIRSPTTWSFSDLLFYFSILATKKVIFCSQTSTSFNIIAFSIPFLFLFVYLLKSITIKIKSRKIEAGNGWSTQRMIFIQLWMWSKYSCFRYWK